MVRIPEKHGAMATKYQRNGSATSEGNILRRKARAAIEAGTLPRHSSERVWGGPGNGECCAVCGRPVPPDELVFEIEIVAETGRSAERDFHPRCFAAWELECDPKLALCGPRLLPVGSQGVTIACSEHEPPQERGT
jgi:hypothetical protein